MHRGVVVALIFASIALAAVVVALVLHALFPDMGEVTIAIICLTMCSAINDTLGVYLYIVKGY